MLTKFQTVIKKFNLLNGVGEFVLLFSGGKDCTFLLDMLVNCFPSVTSKLEALCVMYPHHMYCDMSGDLSSFIDVKAYWAVRGVKITYVNPSYADFDDDDLSGCELCKVARKTVIDSHIVAKTKGTGILTGYTLYDALAYFNMLLYATGLNLKTFKELPTESTTSLVKTLHKVKARETLPSGKIMIRPLLWFNETEIKDYLSYKEIPYIDTPCKIAKYKFKRRYFSVLDVCTNSLPSYDNILDALHRHDILLDKLPFDKMVADNFFVDC